MAEFEQTFGFNASSAISELGRLDAAIDQVNASIGRLSGQRSKAMPTFDGAAKGAAEYKKQGVAATNQVGRGLKSNTQSAKELTISWETFTRVLQTQLIIRTFNSLRDLFFESANAAQEFQLQVARIQQISKGATFGELEAEIERITIALGQPLADVASATFEGLQNDLGTLDETLKLIETDAQNLALVTGGTLTQAINALSSVIKAYGLDISEASGLSDAFFQAIDSGRITLGELENAMGTILPLAAQLGVSAEEILAAMSAITLSGTKASVATTQLRNVLQKGIRPTEAMNAALEKLGVETFAQLVEQTGGLRGALTSLSDVVGGDAEQLSEMFNTIRGGLGAFNLLANESREFTRVQNDMENSAGRAAEAVESINQTDARKAQVNAARLEVLIKDLGDTALATKTRATELFLGLVPDAQAAETALASLGSAALVFGARMLFVSKGVRAALAPIGPLALVVGASLATAFAIDQLGKFFERLQQVDDELIRISRNAAKVGQEIRLDKIAEDAAELTDVFRRQDVELQGFIGFAQRSYDEIQRSAADTNRVIEGLGKEALTRFSNTTDGIIEDIKRAIDTIPSLIKGATNELRGIQQEIGDVQFEQSLRGLDDQQVATRRLTRANELLADARKEAAQAGLSEEGRERARLAFQRARDAQRDAQSSAERLGNSRLIAQADRQQIAVLRAQEAATKNYRGTLQGLNKEELREQFLEQAGINEEMKEQVRNIQELERTFDSSGAPKTVKQMREDLAEARKQFAEFQKTAGEFVSAEVVDLFGFQDLAKDAVDSMSQSLESGAIDWSRSVQDLSEKLQAQEFQGIIRLQAVLDAPTGVESTDALIGGEAGIDPLQQVKQQRQALKDFLDEQIGLRKQASNATKEMRDATIEAREEAQRASTIGFWESGTVSAKNLVSAANAVRRAVELIPVAGKEDLAELRRGYSKLSDQFNVLVEQDLLNENQQERIRTAITAVFNSIQARSDQIEALELIDEEGVAAAERRVEELSGAIRDNTKFEVEIDQQPIDNAKNSLDNLDTSAQNGKKSVSDIGPAASGAQGGVSSLSSTTGGLATRASGAAQNFREMERAAIAASVAAANAASAGGSGFAYHGGQVNYRASGGPAGRGQDSVPTMLSPGEFVVNSRQSKNFFSQLSSINAGNAAPPSDGGGTTVNIGDVNVTSSAQIPSESARDIGRSIKREIRRKAFKL